MLDSNGPQALTPLLLVAASGLAREVLALLRTPWPSLPPSLAGGDRKGHPRLGDDLGYDVVGFLDDSPALAGRQVDQVPVLGGLDEVRAHPQAQLLVCAGRGHVREALVRRLTELGIGEDRYATLVHPRVELPPGCQVGAGSIILAGVVLTAAVTVGRHVVVMPTVTLTHDDTVEDFATLCAGVSLGGGVSVARSAYLGMNAAVREHVRVGAGATLGMGAALLTDLPDGQTWAGVPARPLPALAGVSVTETGQGLGEER